MKINFYFQVNDKIIKNFKTIFNDKEKFAR